MIRVKICGLTNPDDAAAAARAGADAVGFVFAASPRRISPARAAVVSRALPPFVVRAGVFVNERYDDIARTAEAARLHVLQLHGEEDQRLIASLRRLGYDVVKAMPMRDEQDVAKLVQVDADGLLLDAYSPQRAGGTGRTFDWRLARRAMTALSEQGRSVPVVLAGGLTPDNVVEAIETVRPDAVDVSSGVERTPGCKCPIKMSDFVRKVRECHGSAHVTRRGA